MEDFASNVSWLFTTHWRLRMGNWDQIPHDVRTFDRHKTEIPNSYPTAPVIFNSDHRHFHCFHTFVIVDNIGNLCYIHSGFTRHMNDALCFSNLPQIGPNTNREFPDDCHLLVDLGYHCRYPLMTPYRRLQHLIKED